MNDATAKPFRPGSLPPGKKLQTRSGVLEYTVSGSGPSIVLLSGAGMTLEGWRGLYPAIEQIGTVFAWNRFGVKGSDPPRLPQTGAVVIASLRELLAYAGVRPPHVLLGHSLGGLYANLFARLYPGEISAVLFVEAKHPGDSDALHADASRLSRALAKVQGIAPDLFSANLHSEIEAVEQLVLEIASAGDFPDVPVSVVTGGADPPKWLASPSGVHARDERQRELTELSPQGEQVIAAGSGHFPQMSEPGLVLDALRALVVRSNPRKERR